MIRKAFARCRSFLGHRGGNTAMMFGLMIVPFLGILGMASDYGLALMDKSRLDGAADAAAIAAVKTAQDLINNKGSTRSDAMAAGTAQALKVFSANAGTLAFGTVPTPTPTWTAGTSGQIMANTVTYTTTMSNQFGKMVGIPTTTVAGTSSAQTVLKSFYQFIFIVDISGSMSIGGTATDVAGLNNDKNIKCAFACHDPYHNRGPDYRSFAKADGWTLKIDYVNSAIQNFIQDLQTQTVTVPGVFSVGIDTFATAFTVLQTPTTNLQTALTAASTIDIEPMALLSVSQGYTRTTSSLNDALSKVTNIGDGSSVSAQKTYFIFLSDGVEDIEGNQIYGRGTDVSYTSACSSIKNNANATLISIVAPYPVVSDNQYPILVAPIASQLVPTMQACATDSSWAFQATDGPGINTAVKTALQQIIQGLTRLTQ